jgi:hypothetical protein
MGYIGQARERLEVLPERASGTGAQPEPGGARADELPALLPPGTQSISVTLPPQPTDGSDRE